MADPKQKLLVIEAHSDDSSISIGGMLSKFRTRYEYHFVLATCSTNHLHHAGRISADARAKEYSDYVTYFDGTWHQLAGLPFDKDGILDTIPKRDLVSSIEKAIAAVEPDILIIQGPSYHHDHTLVYEATIAATRPTARFIPREIYVMENSTYFHSLGPHTDMKPDVYVPLTEQQLEEKLDCFRTCFPSQLRDSGNYLSVEGIRSWARYRGIECRHDYAEALTTYIRIM